MAPATLGRPVTSDVAADCIGLVLESVHGRLLAGETDELKAFTDSKKALRAKYPDPFHWAPFLFLGAPE